MSDEYLLGIDGGQTGTRAILATLDGSVVARSTAGPIRHMFAGEAEAARAALYDVIRGAYRLTGLQAAKCAAVACGMTGILPGSPETEKAKAIIREVLSVERVTVVPDYVTNFLGASGGQAGVVMIAGGGAVAYGRTKDGKEAVAGGFGYLLDDAGSAFDIGRGSLAAAIRAYDGRGVPTSLVRAIEDFFELSDLQEIKRLVYVPDFSRERIAALAPITAALARSGDGTARAIMASAGQELGITILAVIRRLFTTGDPVNVYLSGGVFNAGDAIRAPLLEELHAGWPQATLRDTVASPPVGALILARDLCELPATVEWLAHVCDREL